ncbi:MAG: helix-turn-helix transcriptional regulator [Ruminiclostridium sp.]|nr:helix-turn-helix transcriptional regulator [Ruminiclostridium sp.]
MLRVKELREEKGLNMRQTAISLGIPYTTYISYEKGEREPNSEMLISLADFFNCSIDYLLGRSEERIDEEVLGKALSVDNDLLAKHGNLYEAQKAQAERDAGLSIEELFCQTVSRPEIEHITKYRTLDGYGKRAVDEILKIEYERCSTHAEAEPTIKIKHSIYKASAGFGFDLEDRDEWDEIEIPDTPEANEADFAVTIYGNSMEPIYHDSDIVLVKIQDRVNIGETGIFIVNGQGFIKQYGGDRLISVNSDYEDIVFSEGDFIKCAGKVIGTVKAS